jgi:hypothetical protein
VNGRSDGRTGGRESAGSEKANGTPMEPRSNCPTVRQSDRPPDMEAQGIEPWSE